jgi:divalent metal cation (Fe/Co/Zn/Cd) transporter
VAISFWLLAPYIAWQAIYDLTSQHHPEATTLGIALTASSVVIMPVLGITKQRLGQALNSGATAGEGLQNLMCAGQAAAVLIGLAVTAAWPAAWPVDPAVALVIAVWSAWEGRQAWRGEDCC